MAKVDVDEGRRLDGFLGSGDVAKTRKENHNRASKDHCRKVAKLSSRLAQPHAESTGCEEKVCLFRVVKH